MSLSSSLSSALSGLTASARHAELISSNVANAMTPGYAKRTLEVSARQLGVGGAGVQVIGVNRIVDMRVLTDRRAAEGEYAGAQTRSGFHSGVERAIGIPSDPSSLQASLSGFESALVEAASRPESSARLASVLNSAKSLIGKLGTISDQIQSSRLDADQQIGRTVNQLNIWLEQVSELNAKVRSHVGNGRDPTSFLDQRQSIIDKISEQIPVREVDRGFGEVALISDGGAILLDGKPATFEFDPHPVIVPDMTVEGGGLSGLRMNGEPLNVHARHAPIRDGRLEALFQVRDTLAPQAQSRVDAVARDLVERFQDPATDPTLGLADAGLFTDGNVAFDVADEVGLAGRLQVNAIVDPAEGGALWRLRDGLGAVTPGEVGDASQIQRMLAAAMAPRLAGSGDFVAAERSIATFAADFLSVVSSDRATSEVTESFAAATATSLREEELKSGVDTDYEMQQLLLVEQAYAANARIVETIGDMLDQLTRL